MGLVNNRKLLSALAVLAGIVVMGGVRAHAGFPIRQIIEAEGIFHVPFDAKSIFIGDVSPHMEALPNTDFDLFNFNVGIEFGDDCRHNFVQPGADDANAAMGQRVGQWKAKIVWQRMGKNICGGTKDDLIGGRVTVIDEHDARLKADASRAVLRDYPVENNGQIRSALQLRNEFLPIRDLAIYPDGDFEIFNIFGHGVRNVLHCGCRTTSLGNRILHIVSLPGGYLIHFDYGRFETAGLNPEYEGLDKSDNRNDASKPHHPPVGRRFIVSLGLVLGGFLLGLGGWDNTHNQRCIVRAALVGGGLLLCGLGYGLWLLIASPWTWGWPI
jgi:hypothetical protein